ncbi:MAG TPA: carbohydrate ABC transporter permease [Chthonomonadaceae bacterium]|nr:carbohydrate ABC transporter permease [Chthonomonadaceae bacterium]
MTDALHRIGSGFKYALLVAYLAAVVLPMLWVVYTSAKSTQEIYQNPFGLPKVITAPNRQSAQTLAKNYNKAWIGSHFSRYFLNSLKVVGISLALILLFGSMAAYVLARFEFFGRGFISTLFLSGLLIPMQLILIPLFFQYSDMSEWLTKAFSPVTQSLHLGRAVFSLHDTHAGLILIYVAASLPFTVFVLTAFFRTLPNEVREAAMLDGASEYRIFFSVMMPLGKPGLVTVAIFNFLGLWNEYLFGLVFLNSDELKTLPLGLASISMQAQYKSDFGLLFAGLVIAMLPTLLVYIFLQERLTRGITVGALKG